MNPAHKFEEAIARSLAAWQDEREASAAKIQALLSEGLEMMRERDQARRERDQARRERDQAPPSRRLALCSAIEVFGDAIQPCPHGS